MWHYFPRHPYEQCARAMHSHAKKMRGAGLDRRQEALWITEHDPVYTLGPSSRDAHIHTCASFAQKHNIPTLTTKRGGQVTFHGPGHCMIYPLLDLRARGLGPKAYVSQLLVWLIDAMAYVGIPCWQDAEAIGLWCAGGKIASLGIFITQGISLYGVDLNICGPLWPYDGIEPCGLPKNSMWSLAMEAPEWGENSLLLWHPQHPVVRALHLTCPW